MRRRCKIIKAQWNFAKIEVMYGGLTFSLALLGATCGTLTAPAIHAQMPHELRPCTQPHKQEEEIRRPRAGSAQSGSKVYVVKVTYDGAGGLPKPAMERLTSRVEGSNFDIDSDWPGYVAEVVKEAMQDNGYFKATVQPQVGVVSSGAMGDQVWVTFHVSQGFQYRMGEIQFANASVFPVAELRKQMLLRDGDVFDLSKLRKGIEMLTTLYGAHGYINFVAVPDINVDEAHQRISLTMQLDEGRQFRVGSIQILGLGQQSTAQPPKLELKPGMVFNGDMTKDFYEQNKSILPTDASPRKNTTITQDARAHTVAILFDFRDCHKAAKRPLVTGPVLPRRPF
jgi:Surface antigen variable number repeat